MSREAPLEGPRSVAAHVLHRVAEAQAWATPTLDAALARARLDPRDAALATSMTYGSLRVLPALDAWIDSHVKRPPDPLVRAILRVAAFQLRHLGRVPSHAIVDDAVSQARARRGPKVGGFVNAVARRMARERPAAPHPPERVEAPPWIRDAVEASLGPARAARFWTARPLPPHLDLRVRGDREALAARIAEARPGASLVLPRRAPDVLRLQRAGDPRTLPGFDEGAFAVQELGSREVARLVGARPGEAILDACAGRGGKTTALAADLGPTGRLCAVELHERRLEQIPAAMARLGLETPLQSEAIDLRVGTGGLDAAFARVLVDAPCTGLGTLQRRPEMLLRLKPDDVRALAKTQAAILASCARFVAPGGWLVFAVCSPLAEEGAVHARPLEDAAGAPLPLVPLEGADSDGVLRLGVDEADPAEASDAYQVIRWQRTESLDGSTYAS